MENREVFNQNRQPIKGLDVESIQEKDRIPTKKDWERLQGGMPEVVWVNDSLCNVIHRYINPKDPTGTGKIVPTPIPELRSWDIKTIPATIDGRQVEFPVALVWAHHGKPCESLSNAKYDRVEVYKK